MTTEATNKIYKWIICIAGVFALLPILLSYHDIWDGHYVYEAFKLQDMSLLKKWFFESRWTLQYYFYLLTELLQNNLGIPYKITSNIVSCAAVVGICVETRRILKQKLGVENEFSLLAVVVILVFPPWATLMTSVLTFHITCVWLFLLSVRLCKSNPAVAFVLFICSLSLNSIFAFAVGYTFFDGILTINNKNKKEKLLKIIAFGASLLILFVTYRVLFPPYGVYSGYNSLKPWYPGFYYFAITATILMGICYFFLAKGEDSKERTILLKRVGACLILMFFACVAYWYVGRAIKVQGTNSFTPRHAYLAVIPIAMLFALLTQYTIRKIGRKIVYGVTAVILLVSISYQFVAYQQKYTQLLYENILIESLKTIEKPLPGVVFIVSERKGIPKYLRDFPSSTNWIMLAAYDQELWYARSCTEGINCEAAEITRKNLEEKLAQHPDGPIDGKHTTYLSFSLDNFDPFGNPLYFYYYFAKSHNRFNPRIEYMAVE
ncbi:MAG: hypothetical protein JEY79_04025 [Pseudodesulfovibrio sp.]|nr:hypothetical protein [Pseudodesulfovibrio sp.]